MGVRQFPLCYHNDRTFWNRNNVHDNSIAFNAHCHTAFKWFHTSKAFDNTRDHRTYAQVTKMMTINEKHKRNMSSPTLDPHIMTVTNKNKKVKPKTVTPSKVSANARGCTSSTTIPSRKLVSNGASHSAQQKGFLANRFDILANLQDSSVDCSAGGLRFETGVQPCRDINVPLNTNHAQIPSRDTNNAEIQAHPTNIISGNKRSLPHKEQKSRSNSHVPHVGQNTLHQSVPVPKIEPSTSTFLNKTSKHVQRLQDDQSLVHPEKIPLFVWQNKSSSKDHAACISQNGVILVIFLCKILLFTRDQKFHGVEFLTF